ncbi:MAG: uracil-DNA glycosylase family protein [Lactococcus cremoris]|uniref:Uracil DNA glycosylase n=4 Tax=Lactococcus lactis subsp. cremoris TaxID=1359 RepID=T0SEV9_LACLC|nr:uracil-DNA glycosylase family protein [Lactococcus cremoris]EQC57537.1 uracil DNA glycosylase [Lactococcus cremoris subsp. cremoris TIFN6]EQC84113.1 uracil DNA glycosylase [Lactococcus cremoris subsp. cremoris TIFN7]EQC94668.1 uracil DNA glycosylase [Lactococcus cremoris subsp. cremoris TIFN3]MDU1525667.1 uracil-DNA glycosylase family protein [Lactococcus lactis]ABJ73489.1 Uracil-DNA glycosylase [Lactococcus cremoris subsp. cremoris SK11]
MDKLKEIFEAIKADPQNINYTKEGIEPLYSVHKEAKICIIGQAPGIRAQESRLFWNDPSGERLRDWLGIDRETFYQSNKISILPLDFYFPGKGKSGDLPPRKGFAEKWHEQLLQQMPEIEFFVLVGSYAIKYYLNLKSSAKTTEVIRDFEKYLPKYFPLIHPSPRNNIWLAKNPWFEPQLVPELQKRIAQLMK